MDGQKKALAMAYAMAQRAKQPKMSQGGKCPTCGMTSQGGEAEESLEYPSEDETMPQFSEGGEVGDSDDMKEDLEYSPEVSAGDFEEEGEDEEPDQSRMKFVKSLLMSRKMRR